MVHKLMIQNEITVIDIMTEVTTTLKDVPESFDYTQKDLEILEDIRHTALKLAREAEELIHCFEGREKC